MKNQVCAGIGVLLILVVCSVASADTIVGTDYDDDYATATQWQADYYEADHAAHVSWGGGRISVYDGDWVDGLPAGTVVGYYTYCFTWPTGGTAKTDATVSLTNVYMSANSGYRILTSDDNAAWTTQMSQDTGGGTSSGAISFDVSVDSGDDLYLRFEAYDPDRGTTTPCSYFYDVDVAWVPEPATMSLLGLGGVSLLLRRRCRRRL